MPYSIDAVGEYAEKPFTHVLAVAQPAARLPQSERDVVDAVVDKWHGDRMRPELGGGAESESEVQAESERTPPASVFKFEKQVVGDKRKRAAIEQERAGEEQTATKEPKTEACGHTVTSSSTPSIIVLAPPPCAHDQPPARKPPFRASYDPAHLYAPEEAFPGWYYTQPPAQPPPPPLSLTQLLAGINSAAPGTIIPIRQPAAAASVPHLHAHITDKGAVTCTDPTH